MLVPAGLAFSNFLIGALVVAALYFTREILVPIALAVLLSFTLSPLLRALQRMKLPRSIAVLGAANNLQQSWRFDWEPPKAVLRDVWTIDWILGC